MLPGLKAHGTEKVYDGAQQYICCALAAALFSGYTCQAYMSLQGATYFLERRRKKSREMWKKRSRMMGNYHVRFYQGGGVAHHGYLLIAVKGDMKITPYPTSFCCAKSIIG
jgi:hypothetical protein